MCIVVLLDVVFTLLQIWINGQIGHLLHFFMPAIILVGLLGPMGGTLVLTSLSLIFGGCLYAIKGGRGNTSFKWGSLLTIVLQCFLTIFSLRVIWDHNVVQRQVSVLLHFFPLWLGLHCVGYFLLFQLRHGLGLACSCVKVKVDITRPVWYLCFLFKNKFSQFVALVRKQCCLLGVRNW